MGTLHEDIHIFVILTQWILLRMRKVLNKSHTENQNIILCSIKILSENCAIYEVNVEKYGTAWQATAGILVWCMWLACQLNYYHYIVVVVVVVVINCNWVVTQWQWLFYMYTKYKIGY